jgi:6-phosphofructokinase
MQIYGIKYGLRGFYSRDAKPMELNAAAVEGIHLQGGTVLVCLPTTINTHSPTLSLPVHSLSRWVVQCGLRFLQLGRQAHVTQCCSNNG